MCRSTLWLGALHRVVGLRGPWEGVAGFPKWVLTLLRILPVSHVVWAIGKRLLLHLGVKVLLVCKMLVLLLRVLPGLSRLSSRGEIVVVAVDMLWQNRRRESARDSVADWRW